MRLILIFLLLAFSRVSAEDALTLTLQTRSATNKAVTVKEQWLPSRTAMIVCDMWDLHHCRNAAIREAEMAPRMNEMLEKARAAGVLIIHAPSSCMKPYEGTPPRDRAKSAPPAARVPDKIGSWCRQIPAEEQAVYPLDQSDGGEDDDPAEHAKWAKELETKGLDPRAPWTKEIETLRIDQDHDVISDSGEEIWNLLDARRIDNVILAGVHLNTVIPFAQDLEANAPAAKRINDLVHRVAEEEKLTVFDLYPLYVAEQAKATNMLNYRRYSLAKVPENLRAAATPYISDPAAKDPTVIVLDNRLDAIFGQLPGWFGDRHPNLAGYNVIARETARFLAPILRSNAK